MTLPLHHCAAARCQELVDPAVHFCERHLRAIPPGIKDLLANAATPRAIETATDLAMMHLAFDEGFIADFHDPTSTAKETAAP